jgi:response regulator NasT
MALKIVIADDEPLIRRDLAEHLADLGYAVVGAARNGPEALELVMQHEPDVAILDIVMPGIDGLQVAERLATQLPVVLLTAHSGRDFIERAKQAGVRAYLVKPFRDTDVAPAIELAVASFVAQAALNERITSLTDKLETRKLVDRAKGLLMTAQGLSEVAAYRELQKLSMAQNLPMRRVAELTIALFGSGAESAADPG